MERGTNEHDGKHGCSACRSLLEFRFKGMEIRMEYQTLNHCLWGNYQSTHYPYVYFKGRLCYKDIYIYICLVGITHLCDSWSIYDYMYEFCLIWSIALQAIVISGMVVAVNAWCIESRGALFVSVFSPVGLVIVALFGSFVLNETLHLGRYKLINHMYIVLFCGDGFDVYNDIFSTLATLQHSWYRDYRGRIISCAMG